MTRNRKTVLGEKNVILFFISKIEIPIGLHEGHLRYKRTLLKREHPARQNMKLYFLLLCEYFLPFWIRIQPTKINADPCGSGSKTLTTCVVSSFRKECLNFLNMPFCIVISFNFRSDVA
jgi:hypothetical protein